MSYKDVSKLIWEHFMRVGLTSGRAYNRINYFSSADRWAYNWGGL